MLSEPDKQYEEFFLSGRPSVDVRAPGEYAAGAFPGAENLPLLDDEQRSQVGLAYKNSGQGAAIELGEKLISGRVRDEKILAWRSYFERHPDALIYCLRGGLRSQSVASVLREELRIAAPVFDGGYKAGRRFLLKTLENVPQKESFLIISGRTGTGKTRFLQDLAARVRVVDLEHLAQHRGSAFGKRSGGQPCAGSFENRLALAFLQAHRSTHSGPIVLEDESRMIGALTLPLTLFACAQSSPLVVIDEPLVSRVEFLIQEYLRVDYDIAAPEDAIRTTSRLRGDLRANLDAITRRLGGARAQRCGELMEEGLRVQGTTGSIAGHAPWVEFLLVEYYDPVYDRHINLQKERIAFRGSKNEAFKFVLNAAAARA